MASNQLILFATVLLSVLAATSASVGNQCVPGLAIPHNPLGNCRTYVVSEICHIGPRLLPNDMKQRCCWELSAIPAYCRCEALRILMDGVVTAEGVFEGHPFQDMHLPQRECSRQRQRNFAATLVVPQECSLTTIHGGPFCLNLPGPQ
ncbi:alpha-amylase/trypsin inhibitor-like [Lolium rigidum]|uniref:alpha-amylase/trypsin inhibitor-like n=1 Tax=Lolium rigidum TaxID=89674 RepID=UPI001F5DFDF7|nr:alpha-amylase/trypsin inhibitor-like [Lolium rigidum]